jgi:hypothetical protein
MWRALLVSFICGLVLRCATSLPDDHQQVPKSTLDITFKRFDRAIPVLESKPLSASLKSTCYRGFTAYFTIKNVASHYQVERVSARYVYSLNCDLSTISQVTDLSYTTPAQEEMVSYAVLNLEAKAAQAVARPEKWAELVETTVETVHEGRPIWNLQVWYCPRGWATIYPRWQRFAALSTPTTERLAPGIYLIAAKSPNLMAVPMRVGGDGASRIHFVLQVP